MNQHNVYNFNGYISKSTLRARYCFGRTIFPTVCLSILPQYIVDSCEIYQSFILGSSLFNRMNMIMSRYEFFQPAMLYMFPFFLGEPYITFTITIQDVDYLFTVILLLSIFRSNKIFTEPLCLAVRSLNCK